MTTTSTNAHIEHERHDVSPRHSMFIADDDEAAVARAAAFLGPALRAGGAVVIVASARQRDGVLAALRPGAAALRHGAREERIFERDADELLASIFVDGAPDAKRFDREAGALLVGAAEHAVGNAVRVYVQTRPRDAAALAGAHWAEACARRGCTLLTGVLAGGKRAAGADSAWAQDASLENDAALSTPDDAGGRAALERFAAVSAALDGCHDDGSIAAIVVRAAAGPAGAARARFFVIDDGAGSRVRAVPVRRAEEAPFEATAPHDGDAAGDICVPLVASGRVRGLIAFDVAPGVAPRVEEPLFLSLLAAQAARALERVRLREAVASARRDAAEAGRAREDVLSVVSRDLRNPLSAVLMAAGSLLRDEMGDARAQRVRAHAERIHRNVERITRLIEDVVDLNALRAGRLHLSLDDHAPDVIARDAVDMLQAQAELRGVRIDGAVDAPLPWVRCDRDRVLQAIRNAVAWSMDGLGPDGVVVVGASLRERDIVFTVTSTGGRIEDPARALSLASPWRVGVADDSAGLGLRIARGIVEAHGGRVWSETQAEGTHAISLSIPGVVVE